jgi:hypothetical protein
LFEHESDHATDGSTPHGFVNLNDIGTRARLTTALGANHLTVGLLARLHLLTCTVDPVLCASYGGGGGSVAFEAATELLFDGQIVPWTRWRYLVAVYGSVLAGHALAGSELRGSLVTGFWIRTLRRGQFQLVGTLVVGSELGLERALTNEIAVGGGLRWAF